MMNKALKGNIKEAAHTHTHPHHFITKPKLLARTEKEEEKKKIYTRDIAHTCNNTQMHAK